MSTATDQLTLRRELDARTSDGVEVRLVWDPGRDCLFVEVLDTLLADAFELGVDHSDALDAFHHPYAYAAFRGIAFPDPRASQLEPVSA